MVVKFKAGLFCLAFTTKEKASSGRAPTFQWEQFDVIVKHWKVESFNFGSFKLRLDWRGTRNTNIPGNVRTWSFNFPNVRANNSLNQYYGSAKNEVDRMRLQSTTKAGVS